jgi:hypothetical protein
MYSEVFKGVHIRRRKNENEQGYGTNRYKEQQVYFLSDAILFGMHCDKLYPSKNRVAFKHPSIS